MNKLILFGFSIFYLLHNKIIQAEEINYENNFKFTKLQAIQSEIMIQLSQKKTQDIQIFLFDNNAPNELTIQLFNSNLKQLNRQKMYEFQMQIYEYPLKQDCEKAFLEQKFNPENLIASLSFTHIFDHITFINSYYYLMFSRVNYYRQPGSVDVSADQEALDTNLMLKFTDKPNCKQNGYYNSDQNKCICQKNRQGPFCEYDVLLVTNYYPFEIVIKPFEGKYIQIYKIQQEDELKLEMNIKHSIIPDIHMYRSDNPNEFPTQYKYFENLVFNSKNNTNIISANPHEGQILLFIRNPSNSQLYATLNIRNVTLIDETNLILFILLSLFITLAISFFCIFCFNKISKKKKADKHVELQETNEGQNKENQQNGQNGATPQTNRNLIDEIKTQRENQIKSEMEQITQGNKYEQFQLETSFKEQICAICLDDFEYDDLVRKTKCNHMFHEKCLYKWLFKYISCPMCNQDLT
ncbi:C3HC4 type (RING finger) zinc finger protein (macronuclear) [Tetrahymena thermophila SB210]|uniref:C3HC4 type (RING finger) zinc finger protein n=1 Tax=Tetrahymena thermophila (strain SB210) TaxID=312017 RepID=Q22D53_TETTS|nr:C3HC4 type (RING finger) zinc finger protein [Tetrahymena thermophila SB210]EAR83200.3 C3HC4 type (RING finger) zinc finger protein [Tetrahymena thermophila SB210]|eukprot:XP_001030863.3 C3HC4 type (RING finger) zinc finger protein [Tetrahymena thermophila SB210]